MDYQTNSKKSEILQRHTSDRYQKYRKKNNQVKKDLPVMIYSNSNMTIP